MANKPNKIIYGNEVIIDLTADTVEPSKLAKGATAHDKSGEIITGTNTYDADTSDATASASEILEGQIAYVTGNKIEGTMPNRGAVTASISIKDEEIAIQSGYHDGSGKVSISSIEQGKIISSNIKDGVEILGVVGTYTGEGVTAQAKTVTPYTDIEQVIIPDEGFDYLSQVTVGKIKYTETLNAQGGLTIEIGEKSPTV